MFCSDRKHHYHRLCLIVGGETKVTHGTKTMTTSSVYPYMPASDDTHHVTNIGSEHIISTTTSSKTLGEGTESQINEGYNTVVGEGM